jgi:hypothetical protein
MTEVKQSLLLFCVLTAFLCPTTRGTESGRTETKLTFKDRPEVHVGGRTFWRKSNWHPAYAAGVADNGSRYFVRPGTEQIKYFLDFAERRDISREQRDFLRATGGGLREVTPDMYLAYGAPEGDPNDRQLLLYAVSREDARKMAEAYLLCAREGFDWNTRLAADAVREASERAATAKKKIPELERILETSRRSLEEIQKAAPYRTEEEAATVIGDLDKIVNAARVDIAGIQAKIDAIQGYPAEKPSQAVVAKLEVMFVEEAISLRAAEARKREAMNLRTQAVQFIDLTAAIRDATEQKKSHEAYLEQAPQRTQEAEQRLARLKDEEPRIPGNQVFIYPAD